MTRDVVGSLALLALAFLGGAVFGFTAGKAAAQQAVAERALHAITDQHGGSDGR